MLSNLQTLTGFLEPEPDDDHHHDVDDDNHDDYEHDGGGGDDDAEVKLPARLPKTSIIQRLKYVGYEYC